MEGWVKLHRKIQDHWLWQDKPFDKRSAWIDMLLMANHDDNKFLLGNVLVEVQRGSFITSELKLMERWGWSKTKVRSFLEVLQKDKMIIKKSDKKKTAIIIEKYSDYQDSKTTERPQKDHKKTTERPQKDTNKNDKNDKNDKNVEEDIYIGENEQKNKSKKFKIIDFNSYTSNEKLLEALNDFIEMRTLVKKPMTEKASSLLLKKLDNLTKFDNEKIEILNQSILNNWQSVFPLKKENNYQNNGKKASSNPFLEILADMEEQEKQEFSDYEAL